MTYIFFGLIIFVLAASSHIVLHNILVRMGIMTFKTVVVFMAGLIVLFVVIIFGSRLNYGDDQLIFSPIILYLLMTSSYILFFLSPYLGDESPSSKILYLIIKEGKMTEKAIANKFSDKELVTKRLVDMKKRGWIKESRKKYIVLPEGIKIVKFVTFYRKMLGASMIG